MIDSSALLTRWMTWCSRSGFCLPCPINTLRLFSTVQTCKDLGSSENFRDKLVLVKSLWLEKYQAWRTSSESEIIHENPSFSKVLEFLCIKTLSTCFWIEIAVLEALWNFVIDFNMLFSSSFLHHVSTLVTGSRPSSVRIVIQTHVDQYFALFRRCKRDFSINTSKLFLLILCKSWYAASVASVVSVSWFDYWLYKMKRGCCLPHSSKHLVAARVQFW